MKHTIKAIAAMATTATATIIAVVAYATLIILDFLGYLPILPVTTPEFETTPIGCLLVYVQEEGMQQGQYIGKGQAPPCLVIGSHTCGIRGLGIQ